MNDVPAMTPDLDVTNLVIGSAPGITMELLTLGATVHRLEVTGGDGRRRNVVLGHATIADRQASRDFMGCTIGRYANRIAGGRFLLAGRGISVPTNDRGNALHGGPLGFDRQVWDVVDHSPSLASFRLLSPDGDMGFPGNLTAEVTFEVVDNIVRLTHSATTDATTVVNLTNHTYFNLAGDGTGSVDDHLLTVDADEFAPIDDTGIPLGGHLPVDGTPFDLRSAQRIGSVVRDDHAQMRLHHGIDHHLVVRGQGLRRSAVLECPGAATRLEVHTDKPGLQVYTGNFLDGSTTSSLGIAYRQGDGIALEPQLPPDTPHQPGWESAALEPGRRYETRTEWHFSAITGTPELRRVPPTVHLGRQ